METMGTIGVLPITFTPRNIHVVRNTLSRVPNGENVVSDIEVTYVEVSKVISGNQKGQLFGPIVQALHGPWAKDATEIKKLEKLIPMFWIENERPRYSGMLFAPRTSVSAI